MVHRKGCNNQVADALSRRTYPEHGDDAKAIVSAATVTHAITLDSSNYTPECVEVELIYDDYSMDTPLAHEVIKPSLSDTKAIGKLQRVCPDFSDMYAYKESGILPDDPDVRTKVLSSAQDYDFCDSALYKWF